MTDAQNSLKSNLIKYNSLLKHIIRVSSRLIFILKSMLKNFNNNENMDYFYKLFGRLNFRKIKFKNSTSKLAKTKFKVISNMLIVLMEANLDFDKLYKIATIKEKLTKLSKKLKIKIIKFLKKIKNKVIDSFESEIAGGLVNFLIKLSKILLKGLKGLIVGQILNKIIIKKENTKKVRKIKKKVKNKVIQEDINKDYDEVEIVNNSVKVEDNIQAINKHLENLLKNNINDDVIGEDTKNNDKITFLNKELETKKKISDKNPNITENLRQTSYNLSYLINEFDDTTRNINEDNTKDEKKCKNSLNEYENIEEEVITGLNYLDEIFKVEQSDSIGKQIF